MTFTRTEEFEEPESTLREMTDRVISYIDKGVEVRDAVWSAYIRTLIVLPDGISAVYDKLETELIDRVTERLCEEAFGEED